MKIATLMIAASCAAFPVCAAVTQPTGPSLDLDIAYYSRVLTPEGVTRESRYAEKMVRRPGHAWVARVLPKVAVEQHGDQVGKHAGHQEFNHAVSPRHVMLEKNKLRVEFVDRERKAVVAIPSSEYANVNFDGSWENAFFLLDPGTVKAIPLSARRSTVPGTQWREREKDGVFERVLWDEQRQIPLVIESGDRASTFYRRMEVKPQPTLVRELPWQELSGYSQKEFADYLD